MRDIRSLDLNLLKTLNALLDEGSVTRAAERLALTQPAVSGMLNRLRDSFDDPLFVRAQRGLVPTPRAQALALPIKRILGEIEGMLQPEEFEPVSASFTLSIAATDYAQRTILLPLLAELRRQAPGIRVAARPVDNQRVQQQLESGELDLAILTPESTHEGLHARHLYDEQYVCAMRKGHAAAGGLDLDRFCALEHVIMSMAGDAFSGVTDEALAALGRQRRVLLSLPSFLLLLEVLRNSDLIAVLPRRLIQPGDGLQILEPPLTIPGFRKLLVWHERTQQHPAHRWIRALLAEVCN
ncbi:MULTISPECIES: LysR family transcriptional regulator [Gammaproteobacteria]|uniref:Transcriptional regulator, LysR family n=2 Tax=Gammaproteobacteria TaxID=1236 RepID=A0A653AXM0_ECTOL|nr:MULTISPECIES: LysR family transcriptional regulator [Gammaproteobacteria]MBN7822660.1 LysR family transcriptional regulator [Bowmanella yangjiangensis]QTS87982.1 LysR family transcriptional regulator [Pseudomonas khazarica]CAE6932141.1 Transcriptional regulator, LysR family [Pseudomonas oleovorans]HIQ42853.1 LysR family transcriptional regulator [Pseudomonas oleovorans]